MADSIPCSWIRDYVTEVAEAFGGDLASVPQRAKAAKAQLMKFLTSQRPGSLDACNIWVELSDKEHCILARLTEEAMRRYMEDPIFGGKPVAEHRSALVVIKAFRPCFGRVPSHDGKGMTPERYLFLDVDQFQLKGGFGEERWGSPADIASDPNIREWLQGLRQDGGGGNVLKLRKQAQIQSAGEDADGLGKKKVSMRCIAQRQFKPFPTDAPIARRPVSRKLETDHKADAPVSKIVPAITGGRKGRQRSWRFIRSMPMAFVEPPMDVLDRLRELSVDRPDDTEHLAGPSKIVVEQSNNIAKPKSRPKRNPLDLSSSPAASPRINRLSSSPDAAILSPRLPGTPSEWSVSIRGSPKIVEVETHDDAGAEGKNERLQPQTHEHSEETAHEDAGGEDNLPNPVSSYLSPPPPAQRPPATLPPSSIPPPSFITPMKASSLGADLKPSERPASSGKSSPPIERRVPYPRFSRLSPDPEVSGYGRILVPDSDISGSTSQSQPNALRPEGQSQSQSQSQSQPHALPQSQLRNEVPIAVQTEGQVAVSHGEQEGPSQQSLSYASESQGLDQSQGQAEPHVDSPHHEEPTPALQGSQPPSPQIRESRKLNGKDVSPPGVCSPRSAGRSDSKINPQACEDPAVEHISETESDDVEKEEISDETMDIDVDGDDEDETDEDEADEDDDMDVDQLLSDSDTDDVSHSVPRVETQRKDELDSDDARTKRQVDRYLSHSQLAPLESQTSQSGHPPNAYSPEHRRSSTRAADVQGESSGGPVLPHSPDVFTDEDSFRQSDVDVGLSPKVQANSRPADSSSARPAEGSAVLKSAPLQNGGVSGGVPANGDRPQTKSVDRLTNHDAKAWAAPAFMRSERNGMDKGKTQALEPEVFKPLGAKRRNSSPLSPEQPIKRRKVTSESSTIAHAPTIAGVSKLHDAQAAKSTDTVLPPKESNGRGVVKIPHIDLRRSGSISSSSSKKRMKPGGSGLQSTNSKPEIHVVKTISSQGLPYEVKHVDFHGGLLSSKYSHARKSKERQLQDRLVQSTEDTPNHVVPQRPAVTPSTSHLGSVKPIPTMDRHKAESSSRGPRVPATGAALARQNASQSSAPLLGVRQPTFGMAREEEGPPLVTWDGMMRILMRTGQMRNKQLRQGG